MSPIPNGECLHRGRKLQSEAHVLREYCIGDTIKCAFNALSKYEIRAPSKKYYEPKSADKNCLYDILLVIFLLINELFVATPHINLNDLNLLKLFDF